MEADLRSLMRCWTRSLPDVLVVMGWGYHSVREGGLVGLEK